MITHISIDGFKSFRGFKMEFTPFTVIAGLNASGKSNLFDALELLSRLATLNLRDAFPERRGSVTELFTLVEGDTYLSHIDFKVEMLVSRRVKDNWGQEADIKSPRLRYELRIERGRNVHGFEELFVAHEKLSKIPTAEDSWSKHYLPRHAAALWKSTQAGGSAKPFIETEPREGVPTIYIRQDGRQGGKATPANAINQTVLAGTNSVDFPHVFAAKEEMRSWQFMQLNPDDLRKPTVQDAKMSYYLSHSGANLAAALYRIKTADPDAMIGISRQLMRFLPEFVGVDVVNDEANKQFIVRLKNKDGKEFSSRVLSEGTLRLLALMVIQADPEYQGLLCFEEPENGIHPMRIPQMARLLLHLTTDFEEADAPLRQAIVNTHSPLLVREMLQVASPQSVSVWLSKMHTLVTTFEDRRVQMKCSTVNRVSLDPQTHLDVPGAAFTIADLTQYLATINESVESASIHITTPH
ncbi:MAG: AAA family ATPase [Bacteroidia bacterium]|nr:AAA family ATPase [Bacteroidia bacterium]